MKFGHGQWRKSSFSTDQTSCVEIAYPDWRKATLCTIGESCVEVAYSAVAPTVGIRDSKNPTGGNLTLPHTALHHLIRTL